MGGDHPSATPPADGPTRDGAAPVEDAASSSSSSSSAAASSPSSASPSSSLWTSILTVLFLLRQRRPVTPLSLESDPSSQSRSILATSATPTTTTTTTNTSNSLALVDCTVGAAVSLGLSLVILKCVHWMVHRMRRELHSNNNNNNNNLGPKTRSESTTEQSKSHVDFDDSSNVTLDSETGNSIVTRRGSCHCRSVVFQWDALRKLHTRSRNQGKIRYHYATVPTLQFQLLAGGEFLQTYYVLDEGGTTSTLCADEGGTLRYRKESAFSSNRTTTTTISMTTTATKTTIHPPDPKSNVGAHVFCKRCGVHILYAPSPSSLELEINIDCWDSEKDPNVNEQRRELKTPYTEGQRYAVRQWHSLSQPQSKPPRHNSFHRSDNSVGSPSLVLSHHNTPQNGPILSTGLDHLAAHTSWHKPHPSYLLQESSSGLSPETPTTTATTATSGCDSPVVSSIPSTTNDANNVGMLSTRSGSLSTTDDVMSSSSSSSSCCEDDFLDKRSVAELSSSARLSPSSLPPPLLPWNLPASSSSSLNSIRQQQQQQHQQLRAPILPHPPKSVASTNHPAVFSPTSRSFSLHNTSHSHHGLPTTHSPTNNISKSTTTPKMRDQLKHYMSKHLAAKSPSNTASSIPSITSTNV